jgi:hypothetical protein
VPCTAPRSAAAPRGTARLAFCTAPVTGGAGHLALGTGQGEAKERADRSQHNEVGTHSGDGSAAEWPLVCSSSCSALRMPCARRAVCRAAVPRWCSPPPWRPLWLLLLLLALLSLFLLRAAAVNGPVRPTLETCLASADDESFPTCDDYLWIDREDDDARGAGIWRDPSFFRDGAVCKLFNSSCAGERTWIQR